jgi:hypothetical protein
VILSSEVCSTFTAMSSRNLLSDHVVPTSRFLLVCFLWAKGLSEKDIHNEMFPVYGGKCLSCKTVHNFVQKRGKRFPDDEEVETVLRKWRRQQSQDFCVLRVSMHW